MNWVVPPKPWWSTVYVESRHVPPSDPTQYDEALGRLAWQLANKLITVLPSNFGLGSDVPTKPYVGYGLAGHQLQVGWPRVMPRVVVKSPHESSASDIYYRHDPRVFDGDSRWSAPDLIANDIGWVIDKFRRNISDNNRARPASPRIKDIEGFCKPVHPSSYRLGQLAARLSNKYVTLECQRLEVPKGNWPTISLEGLQVERLKHGVMLAEPCEASF